VHSQSLILDEEVAPTRWNYTLSSAFKTSSGFAAFASSSDAHIYSSWSFAPGVVIKNPHLPKLYTGFGFSLSSIWLQKKAVSPQLLYSDLSLRLKAPKMWSWDEINLSLSPSVFLKIPISQTSRYKNRFLGMGSKWTLMWKSEFIKLSYQPAFLFWAIGANSPSKKDKAQRIATLKNQFRAKTSYQNHSLQVALGLAQNFSSANFYPTSSTQGKIQYTYLLPIDFSLALKTGIRSSQSFYTKDATMRVPFFDSLGRANNDAEIFLGISMRL